MSRPEGLRPGPANVDARVVVRAADARPTVGVDVYGCRQVELPRARTVAGLPDREELGEAAAVAGGQGRRHRVEGVGERARDAMLVEVAGARLDVV